MIDGEVQAVGSNRAVQQMMRRARVAVAEFIVGIAPRPGDMFLEPRRNLQSGRDLAHFQTPGIVLQGFGGGSGERSGGAGPHRASQQNAASEQGSAVEQAVAGYGFDRWRIAAVATFTNAHEVLPVGWVSSRTLI